MVKDKRYDSMNSRLFRPSTLLVTLLFFIYVLIIWLPFLSFFTASELSPAGINESSGQYITDEDLDSLLNFSTWTADLKSINLESAASYKLSKAYGISRNNRRISFYPFNEEHLNFGDSSWLLSAHSLVIVKASIYAFIETGETSHLSDAVEYLKNYIRFEEANNYSQGFLFNDHAVAARVHTTTLLWRHYRNSPLKNRQNTEIILGYIYKLNSRLLNDSFYNYRTNHGTMQNIALMLSATVFPDLPDSEQWGDTGKSRLEEQLGYLVSSEGFFLEHSFGYQNFMITLLQATKAYGEFNSKLVSSDINSKLGKMISLFNMLIREDGTLPVIGDTNAGKQYTKFLGSASTREVNSTEIFAESGLLTSRNNFSKEVCLSQGNSYFLTLFWSNYFNHGHKRWDDMSVDFWACGSQWWRNIGYVPYWHSLRRPSETWYGSNAPHLADEEAPAPGSSEVIQSTYSDNMDYYQTRRKINSASIYRDTFRVDNLLFVHDFLETDEPGEKEYTLEANWTIDFRKQLHENAADENQFTFVDSSGNSLKSRFYSKAEGDLRLIRGSDKTPLGWVEHLSTIQPTTTIRTQSTASNPSVSQLSLLSSVNEEKNCNLNYKPDSYTPNSFVFDILACGQRYRITKQASVLTVETSSTLRQYQLVDQSPKIKEGISTIDKKTELALSSYGRYFRPLTEYRIRITYLGAGLLALTLVMFFAVKFFFSKRVQLSLVCCSIISWLILIAWVKFIYFR